MLIQRVTWRKPNCLRFGGVCALHNAFSRISILFSSHRRRAFKPLHNQSSTMARIQQMRRNRPFRPVRSLIHFVVCRRFCCVQWQPYRALSISVCRSRFYAKCTDAIFDYQTNTRAPINSVHPIVCNRSSNSAQRQQPATASHTPISTHAISFANGNCTWQITAVGSTF